MVLVTVPILAASADDALAQAQRARAAGADLVELRIDRSLAQGASARDLVAVIPRLPLPVAATIRHASEGGGWSGSEDERLALYAACDEAGAAYVDIELAHHRPGWKPARARLILSHHDFAGMGSDLGAAVARMRGAGADVAKIAVTARDAADLAVIERLHRDHRGGGPMLAIAMGEHGLPSRLLAGAWGSCMAFARLPDQPGSAPGQPLVSDLLDLYRLRAQGADTRVFGVIGSPVAHSLSPLIHNAAFAASAIDAVYVPFRVEDPLAFWRACEPWIEGLSVTIPHKHALIDEVDSLEEVAASIGAINTIYRSDTGSTIGANTDAVAIVRCLEEAVGVLACQRVLVLGAGGAARAAALACRLKGADVTIANRTYARAHELALTSDCHAVELSEAPRRPYDVLINGTSVGMGKPEDTPWPREAHRAASVVFDTVYTPLQTRLLREAAAAGATTICGLDMFIDQAVGQFTRWTAIEALER
jgi:3-dehydroquinate dehydratase / shikimate dehydrogenase